MPNGVASGQTHQKADLIGENLGGTETNATFCREPARLIRGGLFAWLRAEIRARPELAEEAGADQAGGTALQKMHKYPEGSPISR